MMLMSMINFLGEARIVLWDCELTVFGVVFFFLFLNNNYFLDINFIAPHKALFTVKTF